MQPKESRGRVASILEALQAGEREAAEELYAEGGAWREAIRNLYGVDPEITWFETPIIVDNARHQADRCRFLSMHVPSRQHDLERTRRTDRFR